MRIKKISELPNGGKRHSYGEAQMLVKQFEESDAKNAEVIFAEGEYLNAWTCTSTLNQACKTLGVNVKALTIGGKTYLTKTI